MYLSQGDERRALDRNAPGVECRVCDLLERRTAVQNVNYRLASCPWPWTHYSIQRERHIRGPMLSIHQTVNVPPSALYSNGCKVFVHKNACSETRSLVVVCL